MNDALRVGVEREVEARARMREFYRHREVLENVHSAKHRVEVLLRGKHTVRVRDILNVVNSCLGRAEEVLASDADHPEKES